MQNETLHPDVVEAIDEGKKFVEVLKIQNFCEVFGSMAEFNRIFGTGDLSERDMHSIEQFAKIIYNYKKMNRIMKKELDNCKEEK